MVMVRMNPYLVPQPLGRNDSNLITDTLVGLEVKSKLRVVSFDNDLSRLLDGLGSYCSKEDSVSTKAHQNIFH